MSENEKVQQAITKADKTEKKKDKKAKDKKPGFFARAGKWLRELRSELKKVQWPTGKQTLNNTLIVIACVFAVGVCIWVFDALATRIISAIISLFQGV